MSTPKRVARNVIFNWSNTVIAMLAGLITFPILVNRLGDADCGLWLLIISLNVYFELLDLGLRGSLGRNIAFFKAKNDAEGVSSVINTGLGLMLAGSVCVMLATAGAQLFFFELFAVRPEAVADARIAIWLVGINLALLFPFSVGESVLWGYERFDLSSMVYMPNTMLRTVLIFAFTVTGSRSLIYLACFHLLWTIGTGVGMAFFACRMDKRLRLGVRYIRLDTIHQLFDFGIWCFLLSIANVITGQMGKVLVGNRFSVAKVTTYGAAARMIYYARTILLAGSGVLTPLSTAYHAQEKHNEQQQLFLHGGKACLSLGLFFLGGFVFLGSSFLYVWTGREFEQAGMLLTILIAGELLPLSQWITNSTVLGMNRHRVWAFVSLLEVLLIVLCATIFLSIEHSLLSIGLALAIPAAICRGVVQMVYGCRLLNVSLGTYLRQAMLPPLLGCVFPIAILAAATQWHAPASWPQLIVYGSGYVVCFALAMAFVVVGIGPTMRIWQALRTNALPSAAEIDITAPKEELDSASVSHV